MDSLYPGIKGVAVLRGCAIKGCGSIKGLCNKGLWIIGLCKAPSRKWLYYTVSYFRAVTKGAIFTDCSCVWKEGIVLDACSCVRVLWSLTGAGEDGNAEGSVMICVNLKERRRVIHRRGLLIHCITYLCWVRFIFKIDHLLNVSVLTEFVCDDVGELRSP